VRPTNPEIVEATRRRIPVIPRAEMLAELMRLKYSVAVAGAHGKTTTTSMIALVLERGGLDPTAVIGGRLSAFGSSARLGRGDLMVVEADESDRSFLKLTPSMAVITNIDQEHLESYRDFEDLQQAFVAFANKVPFYGVVVACADDEWLRPLLPSMTRRVITYGVETANAHYRGVDVSGAGFDWRCTVVRDVPEPCAGRAAGPETLGQIVLHVPGRHNLQNALAAVVVGLDLGLPFARIAAALAEFRGAERRFQDHGDVRGVRVIEDYGHHPTEIAAVIGAARAALGGRLVVVFQPHRYSRTSRLMGRFGPALKGADVVVLTDIYAAGEDPIPNATVDALADAIRRDVSAPVHLVRDVSDVPAEVARLARAGDVILTLGAGSIGAASAAIVSALALEGHPS
jgi:UDP-N-acetylmuramate--alanine ligase